MKNIVKHMMNFWKRIRHDRVFVGGIIWWGSFSVCLYLLSVVVTATTKANSTEVPTGVTVAASSVITNSQQVLLAFILGLFIGMILWASWKRRQSNRKIKALDIFFSRQTRTDCVSGFFFMLLCTAPFLILTIIFMKYPIRGPVLLEKLLTEPGGPFALITGAATLVGTYIAVQAILEMKHTITNYPQLLDRMTELIKDAPDSEEGIMILSYSVLPGSWQVKSANIKTDFKIAISHQERLIKIACLDKVDHLKLLISVARRGTEEITKIDSRTVLDFQIDCEQQLQSIEGIEKYPNEIIENKHKKHASFRHPPERLFWNEMPGYYFIVSDHRAIVVTPVGLPQIDESIDTNLVQQIVDKMDANETQNGTMNATTKSELERLIDNLLLSENAVKSSPKPSGRVETLGFETTDRHIIQMLQHQFETFTSSKKSPHI